MSGHRLLGFAHAARRVIAGASAVAVLTAIGLGAGASPASAATTGSISGTVTAADGGAPVSNICVGAYVRGADAVLVADTATATDGTYTLANIPAGNVDVQFHASGLCPDGVEANFVSQWYDNQPTELTAQPITIVANSAFENIDAALEAAGSISGTVTASNGGAPLEGICVGAYIPGADALLVASVATGADGTYVLNGVPAGDVQVQFRASGFCPDGVASDYANQWWDGQPSVTTAEPVTVAEGATTPNIDAALLGAGTISGSVTAATGGAPINGLCVAAFVPGVDPLLVASTGSFPDGSYSLTGVPSGDVLVEFYSSGFCPGGLPSDFVNQWYDGHLTPLDADLVSVTAGVTTTGINAVLDGSGTITGTVTDTNGGGPLEGICVAAYAPYQEGAEPQLITAVSTEADGTYILSGAPVGSVDVNFYSSSFCPGGLLSNYVTQWYNNEPNQAFADVVTVAAGTTTPNIDAALTSGGSISGTVIAAVGGAQLSGICVSAVDTGPDPGVVASTSTFGDGTYQLDGVPQGDVRVKFDSQGFCPGGVPAGYVTQWSANQPGYFSADNVAVVTGATTTNINAAMASTATPFTISVNGGASASILHGATATLGRSALPELATGTIVFSSSGHPNLCTLTLPATTCTTSAALPIGSYAPISADFTDTDGVFSGSLSTNTVALTMAPHPTAFTIAVNGGASDSITHGSTATLSESGLPALATGTVVFQSAGHGNLCTITLPATSCGTSAALGGGSYSPISAVFTDTDDNFGGSTSTNTVALTVEAESTAFTIAVDGASSHSIVHGTAATLSESGLPGAATGSVVFSSAGHANLCTITLPDTSCDTSTALAVGAYSPISALFTDTDGSYTGSSSINTVALTVASVPGAPTAVAGVAGKAKVRVAWTAPSNGGSAITDYVITPHIGVNALTPIHTHSAGTAFMVSGLTNGTTYTFSVHATNVIGNGPESTKSHSAKPVAEPGVVRSVHVTVSSGKAIVTWVAPAHTGGASITRYTITALPGGRSVRVLGSARRVTISGLKTGKYTFKVRAANSVGLGVWSTHSNTITIKHS